jgi:hypothetical protein
LAGSYGGWGWLVKTDSEGRQQWNQTYGGANTDRFNSVIQTSDGGFALAGSSFGDNHNDAWIVKTDSSGNIQWTKTYGKEGDDEACSLLQLPDGRYVFAGVIQKNVTDSGGDSDFWLVKIDSAGNLLWNKTYEGQGFDIARSMIQTNDGGYAVAGFTGPYHANGRDFWLIKTDSVGNLLWNKTYSRIESDFAYSLIQTNDGGYALAGRSMNNFLLIKTDSSGVQQWAKTYGETGGNYAYSVIQTSDGGYALAGIGNDGGNSSCVLMVKTDSGGNQLWTRTYGDTGYSGAYSVLQVGQDEYVLAGFSGLYRGDSDMWLIKVES